MALSLHFSFSKPALEAAVLAGQYPNIRTFQYGGMSVNSETFHADAPKFATSDGAAPWYNLTYGASIRCTPAACTGLALCSMGCALRPTALCFQLAVQGRARAAQPL